MNLIPTGGVQKLDGRVKKGRVQVILLELTKLAGNGYSPAGERVAVCGPQALDSPKSGPIVIPGTFQPGIETLGGNLFSKPTNHLIRTNDLIRPQLFNHRRRRARPLTH